MAVCSCMVRILGLAALMVLALVFLLPADAHAHTQAPVDAQVTDANEHPDDAFEQSALGHCHGEVFCSGGLHIVDLSRHPKPGKPGLPGPDRTSAAFTEVALARDPPVPISLL
jgi:hypothetical protein